MPDEFWQVVGPLFAFFGVVVTVWGSIRVGRNSNRQRQEADTQAHELGLIDRYKEALNDTETRLNGQIKEIKEEMHEIREELRVERALRQDTEAQRDAAVNHAKTLRDSWPDGTPPVGIPQIIADFFKTPGPTARH